MRAPKLPRPVISWVRGSTTRMLWLLTGLVALVLIALVVIGAIRDHNHKAAGADETAYIQHVNRLQGLATGSLVQMNNAYADFGTPKGGTPAQLTKLTKAVTDLRALRRQVAAVKAPDDARALRLDLLHLIDLQAAFANDVLQFAAYLPRASGAERQADGARLELLRGLRASKTAEGQGTAFDHYAEAADAAASKLDGLRAPAEFDVARSTEAARLHKLATVATDAAAALRSRNGTQVKAAIATFAEASSSTAVALRQRAAALAYNRRRQAIERQRTKLEREEVRLQKTL